jgi:pSer/pThr/pTyr-binding forkhead associated (FHA) protein
LASLSFVVQGDVQIVPIDQGPVVLGRGPESDIRFMDTEMSRKHCEIRGAGGFKVVDLGSRNGTFVNGEKIDGERALKSGDQLKVGQTQITFEAEAAVAAAPPPPPPPAPPPKQTATRKLSAVVGETRKSMKSVRDDATLAPGTQPPARPAVAVAPPEPPVIEPEIIPEEPAEEEAVEAKKSPTESQRGKRATTRRGVSDTSRRDADRPGPRAKKKMSAAVLGGIAGGALIIVGGVLFMLVSKSQAEAAHLKEMKTKLDEELSGINGLSGNDSIGRDERVEKILANAEYAKLFPAKIKALQADHDALHAQAEADRAAAPHVAPWLEKYAKVKEDRATFEAQVDKLFEEAKGLHEKYGNTVWGDRVVNAMTEIKTFVDKNKKQ